MALLVRDLEQQRELGESIQILLVDHDTDGLSQVTELIESTAQRFTEVHIVSHGADAQFALGNVVIFQPDPNANGVKVFSYQLTDGGGLSSDPGDHTINLQPVLDPVTITGQPSITIQENTRAARWTRRKQTEALHGK